MATPRPRRRPHHLVYGFVSPARVEREGPLVLARGKGVYVWDSAGRRYLDGLAGLWNVAVGHGRGEIARAVAAQLRELAFAPTLLGFSSPPAETLAARLARLAPRGLGRVLFTSGGSEANETVIRLVRLYWRLRGRPDKTAIVALDRAYHGSTTGAATLTGLPYFHEHFDPLLPGVVRMCRPYCYRCPLGLTYPACALACADQLEEIIRREGGDRIGAVIAEPVQGVGGVVDPPRGYFERIRAICDRHEVLLVADEVITGFGRLGHWFGVERAGVVPDLLVFAKGVTSGYLPLGGVLVRNDIWQTLVDAGPDFTLHHGFTYSGHPAACAAALANLDIIEREGLVRRARRLAPVLARALQALARHALVGEVRTAGLMGAVELVVDRAARAAPPSHLEIPRRVRAAALARGVIVRASADAIVVCPPLVITESGIARLAGAIDAALTQVTAELEAAGTPPR